MTPSGNGEEGPTRKTPTPLPARDIAFQKAGRNLANFQRLERVLRAMIPQMAVEGTTTTLESEKRAQVRSLKKASFGTLSDALHRSLYDGEDDEAHEDPVSECAFRFRFRIEGDEAYVQSCRKRWLSLVKERNRLVHKDLLEFDLESQDDCERLAAHLDDQNARIHAAFEELRAIDANRLVAAKVFREMIESGEFERLIAGDSQED